MRFRTDDTNQILCYQLPKHPVKIMVLGGICGYGKSPLHIVKEKVSINGEYYRNVVLPFYIKSMNELMPDKELATLMQDGAPSHSADEKIKLIESQLGDNYWGKGIEPGGSPDLNPIEHCWSLLQDSVFIEPMPKTREELIERVTNTWNNMTNNYLQSLVDSLPNRINELKEKRLSNVLFNEK